MCMFIILFENQITERLIQLKELKIRRKEFLGKVGHEKTIKSIDYHIDSCNNSISELQDVILLLRCEKLVFG